MPIDRRDFLKLSGMTALASSLPSMGYAADRQALAVTPDAKADAALTIGTGLVEVASGRIISTTTYNGQFPGPLLRFKAGQKVIVDIRNDTDTSEQLHWHGQFVPADIDGAAEERTPYIPAHGMRREIFVPAPSGLRFYHTHLRAGSDLSRGQYNGQVGAIYIEPKADAGSYDREVFLVLKEFEPFFSQGGDMAQDFLAPKDVDPALKAIGETAMKASLAKGMPHGYEVGYRVFTINGKMLGHGEPIRVKHGERVLFHVINGSATEIRSLALPGHTFKVLALDGNPVPTPAQVPVLWLGTAERVSAIVAMDRPGVWVLGDLSDDDRGNGMGIVIEYAGTKGKPRWEKPPASRWDYRTFGKPDRHVSEPDEVIEMTFAKDNAADHGFNRWTVNGTAYDMHTMPVTRKLSLGRRYRLRLHNTTDDIHPIHLHRNSFELTRIAGQATAGVIKDVALLGGYQSMDLDFTADQPGLTLFHCHSQLHMDYGFMVLFDCA
ncbi:multicopper oxidase domain-containing protein [Oleiagrimonas sp. C23AA]|uniref:multicopper oxidase family protein n=1 Tax=Oleiagrimonas sp. C23AA TaxID=2719047 RepID=UPI00197F709D|nr:multicopper oxidase domain-containing protein [Oleiagrimonas sp. C23AA]